MKIKHFTTAVLLIVPFSFAIAQSDENYVVPLTEWGQPDLQGVWNFNSETPMQRPEEFGDREFLTSEEIQQARIEREESRSAADAAEAELLSLIHI